jgi:hypothetical protein
MSDHKTYQFSTLQELFNRVPSSRMMDCMGELCAVMIDAKRQEEAMIELAKISHEKAGTEFVRPETVVELGLPLEWIDDGKDSPPVKIEIGGKDGRA